MDLSSFLIGYSSELLPKPLFFFIMLLKPLASKVSFPAFSFLISLSIDKSKIALPSVYRCYGEPSQHSSKAAFMKMANIIGLMLISDEYEY